MSETGPSYPQYLTHPRRGDAARVISDVEVRQEPEGFTADGIDGFYDSVEDLKSAADRAGVRMQYSKLRGTPRS